METIQVSAHWDAKARVWWAESNEIAGLTAETTTHEGLVAELRSLVPALVAMSMPELKGGVTLRIVSDQVEEVYFS